MRWRWIERGAVGKLQTPHHIQPLYKPAATRQTNPCPATIRRLPLFVLFGHKRSSGGKRRLRPNLVIIGWRFASRARPIIEILDSGWPL